MRPFGNSLEGKGACALRDQHTPGGRGNPPGDTGERELEDPMPENVPDAKRVRRKKSTVEGERGNTMNKKTQRLLLKKGYA